VALYQMS